MKSGVVLVRRLETIILYCLKKLNGERTIFSVYHLLNGKKSSQTIQDAHLFSLKRFFGIFDSLSREEYEEIIDSMHRTRKIYSVGDQRFLPDLSLSENLSQQSIPVYLNGWKFHQVTHLFWKRLSLFVQVVSNLTFQETRYTPIQSDKTVQAWVKLILLNTNTSRKELGNIIYRELIECLAEAKELNPAVLVFRLTGSRQIGFTASQTAIKLNMDVNDYYLEFQNILHFLIHQLSISQSRFPLLANLVSNLKQTTDELTDSTRKTQQLLNQGYSLETIANMRHLKKSTIEDHIVELALHLDDFDISPYVDSSMQREIVQTSGMSTTKQLKRIKDEVQAASYFQIRLVLARYGDRT